MYFFPIFGNEHKVQFIYYAHLNDSKNVTCLLRDADPRHETLVRINRIRKWMDRWKIPTFLISSRSLTPSIYQYINIYNFFFCNPSFSLSFAGKWSNFSTCVTEWPSTSS